MELVIDVTFVNDTLSKDLPWQWSEECTHSDFQVIISRRLQWEV